MYKRQVDDFVPEHADDGTHKQQHDHQEQGQQQIEEHLPEFVLVNFLDRDDQQDRHPCVNKQGEKRDDKGLVECENVREKRQDGEQPDKRRENVGKPDIHGFEAVSYTHLSGLALFFTKKYFKQITFANKMKKYGFSTSVTTNDISSKEYKMIFEKATTIRIMYRCV